MSRGSITDDAPNWWGLHSVATKQYLSGGLLLSLPVFTRGISPRNVVVGGLVQVLLDVVEGVLGHIGHSQVGVLPHSALCSLQLPGEQLDHGGLASSVCSNDSHARVEGDSNADALKDLAGCVGVSANSKVIVSRVSNSTQPLLTQIRTHVESNQFGSCALTLAPETDKVLDNMQKY